MNLHNERVSDAMLCCGADGGPQCLLTMCMQSGDRWIKIYHLAD